MRIHQGLTKAALLGCFLWIVGGLAAPAAQAVVPCTTATSQGSVTSTAPNLKACLLQLQRSDAVPDGKGWVYGQFGRIRVAAGPRQSWRYYEDSASWSLLDGYPGRLPPAAVVRRVVPQPPGKAEAVAAPESATPRPTFGEALQVALSTPSMGIEDPHQLGGPGSLSWSISQFGFLQHIQGPQTCGVWVEGRGYRIQSPSKPHCAQRLAQLAREVAVIRTVKATWHDEPMWLGADAVYVKDDKDQWVAWADF